MRRKPVFKRARGGSDETLKQISEVYIRGCKARNLAKSTIDNYEYAIKLYIMTMEESRNDEVPPDEVDTASIERFVQHLQQDAAKKPVAVQSYIRCVRAFIYWMQDNGYCKNFNISLPKAQQKVKAIYTTEEIQILLQKPDEKCSEIEYMIWILENLVFSTGLRLRSVITIRVEDIAGNVIYINETKNKAGQTVVINQEVQRLIRTYIRLFKLTHDDFLFCTAERAPYNHSTIKHYVAKYNRARGIEKTSIHLMRHTYAYNYYMRTHDVYALQHILGHADISTTQRYLHSIGIDDAVQSMTAYNPQAETQRPTHRRRGRMRS